MHNNQTCTPNQRIAQALKAKDAEARFGAIAPAAPAAPKPPARSTAVQKIAEALKAKDAMNQPADPGK